MKRSLPAILVTLGVLAIAPGACTDILGKLTVGPGGAGGGGGGGTTTVTITGTTTTGEGGSGGSASTSSGTGGKPIGQDCNASSDCAGGICAQGVCCEMECGGVCMSCRGTDTGLDDGTCAPVSAGMDPDDKCGSGGLGTCDGDGACSCANGQKDGGETDVDCGGGLCPKCGGGKKCDENGSCESDLCIDAGANKRCCDTPCQGTCVACDRQGFVGTCMPLPVGTDCGGGKACDDTRTCVIGKALEATCNANSECVSEQCSGSPKVCARNDPEGYPCNSPLDCMSVDCDFAHHLCAAGD